MKMMGEKPSDGGPTPVKVTCKQCLKSWDDRLEYMKDRGCTKEYCLNRVGVAKEPPSQRVKTNKIVVTEGIVQSRYNKEVACTYVDVPKIISVRVFPHKGGR